MDLVPFNSIRPEIRYRYKEWQSNFLITIGLITGKGLPVQAPEGHT
jgi:hypothetical protein